jgi:hypothetical protein
VGLVLAGLASAVLFGGRWHGGPAAAYRAPVESAPADARLEPDGHFGGGGTYGWRGHHHFWGFPFMFLACFLPLLPLFFFMKMMHWRGHRGWHHGHHGHHQAQPPIV